MKYLQKKGTPLNGIHKNTIQIFTGNSAYATAKKWAGEFKQSKNTTDNTSPGSLKNTTIDSIHCSVLADTFFFSCPAESLVHKQ